MPFKYDDGDKTPTQSNSHPLGSVQDVTTELIGNPCNVQQGSPIQGGEEHPPSATIQSAKERMSLINARAVKLSRAFNTCKATNLNRYAYSVPPPSLQDLKESLPVFGLASKIYQAPHYSNDSDIPEIPKEFAGLVYRLKGGQGIATLEEWSTDKGNEGGNSPDVLHRLNATGIGGWEYASHPPSVKEVRVSLNCRAKEKRAKEVSRSQVP